MHAKPHAFGCGAFWFFGIVGNGIEPRAIADPVVSAEHSVSSPGLGLGTFLESVGPYYQGRVGGVPIGVGLVGGEPKVRLRIIWHTKVSVK